MPPIAAVQAPMRFMTTIWGNMGPRARLFAISERQDEVKKHLKPCGGVGQACRWTSRRLRPLIGSSRWSKIDGWDVIGKLADETGMAAGAYGEP